MRDTEPQLQKSQILQISQNCANEIQSAHCRNCKYRRIIQIRVTEPPSQKSQIIQISQNYPNKNSHLLQISQNYVNLWDTEVPIQIPIIEIIDIANTTELCKWEIQNPHCRNRRYPGFCKYRRIIQMRVTEPPSQKSQILQISQNYANDIRIPIAEFAHITNITELCKFMRCGSTHTEPPLQKSQILQISQNYPNEIQIVYHLPKNFWNFRFSFSFRMIVYHLLRASFIPRTSDLRSCKMAVTKALWTVVVVWRYSGWRVFNNRKWGWHLHFFSDMYIYALKSSPQWTFFELIIPSDLPDEFMHYSWMSRMTIENLWLSFMDVVKAGCS